MIRRLEAEPISEGDFELCAGFGGAKEGIAAAAAGIASVPPLTATGPTAALS